MSGTYGEDWTGNQIDAAVVDYFAMFRAFLQGEHLNKAEHNRALQVETGRVRGAIEFKHRNISAVLLGLGHHWLPGYRPADQFQQALEDAVIRWLNQHPH